MGGLGGGNNYPQGTRANTGAQDPGGGSSTTTTTTSETPASGGQIGGVTADKANGRKLSSGGFPDDGAKRMPSASDKVARENARKKVVLSSQKSGRASTNLSGTRTYVNNFLGGTL